MVATGTASGEAILAIRLATTLDLDELADVEKSAAELFIGTAMEFAVAMPSLEPEKLRSALEQGTLWVADEAGTVGGFLCARRLAGLLYVDEIAVHRSFQRRGLGRRLLETLIETARAQGQDIALTTDRDLPWNAPFYAGMGFKVWNNPAEEIRAILRDEAAAGLDRAQRCAMILQIG
jgi:GNAT superfamily N-acetyltransferase